MKKCYRLGMLLTLLISFSITMHAQNASPAYKKEVDDWHADRMAELKADDGWLNLVGLFWLKEGRSSFGSDSSNNLVFPKGSIAGNAGYFERNGNTVTLITAGGAGISIDGKPITSTIIFSDTMRNLPLVASGSLRWMIIQRDDKIGVRLRDLSSPGPASFNGVDRFPVDSTWKVTAVLQKPLTISTIEITNVIGQTTKQNSPGKLVFSLQGKQYSLDVLQDGDDLLAVFGDATSGITTYPSGRFVQASKPGPDGTTVLDFNEAYNPPCAFTNYATCPLPPRQNILPVAITAGEKNYGDHTK